MVVRKMREEPQPPDARQIPLLRRRGRGVVPQKLHVVVGSSLSALRSVLPLVYVPKGQAGVLALDGRQDGADASDRTVTVDEVLVR